MMWTLLLVVAAHAKVPDEVRPVLAPADVEAQYAEYLAQKGREGPTLACDALWAEARLCFKITEGRKRRWVTDQDLQRWKVDLAGLRDEITRRSLAPLEDLPERVAVEGTGYHYWSFASADGWAASAVLHPDRVAEVVGARSFLVAAPVEGVVLAWLPGQAELDRIMAVGAKDMYASGDGPVTPVLYHFNDGRWAQFAEAHAVQAPN